MDIWKWEEEVGGGRLRERGRWLQECDQRAGPGRGDFQCGSSLPPSLRHSLLGLASHQSPPPLLPQAAPSPAQTGLSARLPPDECPSSCPPRPRPSGSGFHFPHLTWGNPRAGTSPPGRPRLRLFIPHPRHTFSALHSPPRKGTHRSGAPAQAPAQPCRMASGCPLEGSRAGCCPVSLLLFQELLSPLFWEVFMRGQRVTPPLPSLPSPLRGQRWGAQPWKPPLCYPSSFQFGFELQLPGGGPRGPGGSGV